MRKQISSKIIALVFGILAICFSTAFYIIAWQEPSQTAPEGNVATPINTGSTPQAKDGSLSATVFYDRNDTSYYLNPDGTSKMNAICLGGDCRNVWMGWSVPSDVKNTTVGHDGKFAASGNGYKAMYDWIQANGCAGYHVCDAAELARYSQLHDMAGLSVGWYNSGLIVYPYMPGFTSVFMVDCNGWKTNEFVYPGTSGFNQIGMVWFNNQPGFDACNANKVVMCCK